MNEFMKDFNYWIGFTSCDGTNVSAKDRANFLTVLKKKYLKEVRENTELSNDNQRMKTRIAVLEKEVKEQRKLNADLTEENNNLTIKLMEYEK